MKGLKALVNSKKVIGVGTGSTVEKYIRELNRDAIYIPSSIRTMLVLAKEGFTVSDPLLYKSIDLYIDGADYFDAKGNLIKGKGGALTTEKLLCSMAKEIFIIVQDYKYRETLEGCFVPIEIIPVCLTKFVSILQERGLRYCLRENYGKIGPVMTDLGNCIVDVEYNEEFLLSCKAICGVIEHGFFEADSFSVMIEKFETQ